MADISAIKLPNGITYNVKDNEALTSDNLLFTTSGNNRAVLLDSNGNLYVTQKDTNTHVTQTASTTSAWRKVLSTYNSVSTAAGSITSGTSNISYYDADGPAINTSTGQIYTKGYLMELSTSDTLYTAINNLGWVSDVIE